MEHILRAQREKEREIECPRTTQFRLNSHTVPQRSTEMGPEQIKSHFQQLKFINFKHFVPTMRTNFIKINLSLMVAVATEQEDSRSSRKQENDEVVGTEGKERKMTDTFGQGTLFV